jgi:hypothetical protein
LALRPEKLLLSPSRPPGFAIPARVSSIGYLGDGSIVHLVAGRGLRLKARLPSSAAGKLERGMAMWASWESRDGVLLTQ